MLGLVLTAGGARGAYQAGVLRRIGELPSLRGRASPFAIVTGASAGAINGMFLADLFAAAVSATSYHSGRSFTFVQGRPGHPVWARARRGALATEITDEHVSASAAIPIVFPPVRIRTSPGGESFFGDGALRLVAPLSHTRCRVPSVM